MFFQSWSDFINMGGYGFYVWLSYGISPVSYTHLDVYKRQVCGGGRYDGLVEQLGGHATSGVGFAMGLERLVLLVQEVNKSIPVKSAVDIYVVYQGEGTTSVSYTHLDRFHRRGIARNILCDILNNRKCGHHFKFRFGL